MTAARGSLGLLRMSSRDSGEPHRVASSLELLFDLVFVIAVSQASENLHELLSEGSVGQGVLAYLMVFFAVWWAWMNFTWFASAFDTDDWAYRVLTIVQMGGVLVLAAGVHDAMVSYDFTLVTWGYVIMRLAMVAQWLRAAASDAAVRRTALAFGIGIGIVQVLWVARICMLDATWQLVTFFVLMAAEMIVPVIAERQGRTSWHPHHIAERYGLFTLILLGESLLASATGIFAARGSAHGWELVGLAVAGLAITAGMWWVYFVHEQGERLARTGRGFGFGYSHYVIFAAAGAVSAGIGACVDVAVGQGELAPRAAVLALTLPVGVFLLAVWVVMLRPLISTAASAVMVIAALAIVASALIPATAVAVTVVLLALVVVVLEVDRARHPD
ncbi:low temperature requirement protein A [Microbacterium elymi]|uniref:Low temperature requirement protein A n=1 Tax=Microbacterium elymi TaxID=2909587 RepID=A0ABY5NJ12_9MICO|nr:low temperature requirement protein A [Microbacterium elymi]UUT35136.1 low temperature requirement protein A [Microbacterium elymi]